MKKKESGLRWVPKTIVHLKCTKECHICIMPIRHGTYYNVMKSLFSSNKYVTKLEHIRVLGIIFQCSYVPCLDLIRCMGRHPMI